MFSWHLVVSHGKIVITCLGKYLKGTGTDKVLINTKIWGPISIETVLNGGHYAYANRAFSLIAEIFHVLWIRNLITLQRKLLSILLNLRFGINL